MMKMMLDRADSRKFNDFGWLRTSYTFSFADYYNPSRIHFGALRVLNDDVIAPAMGFDLHPHKNMEVISIPLKGYLRHGDSLEHSDVITPGDIQVMSTGKGIYHSEYNDSKTDMLELLQIWVMPKVHNTEPVYKNYDIRGIDPKDRFGLIVGPEGSGAPASILQDAWFSLGRLTKGSRITYRMYKQKTGVYCFLIDGRLKVGEELILSRRDGVGITQTEEITVEALADSYVLMLEVAMI